MFLLLHLPPPAIQPQATSLQRNGGVNPLSIADHLPSLCGLLEEKKQALARMKLYANQAFQKGLPFNQGDARQANLLEVEICKIYSLIIQHPLYKTLSSQPKSSDPGSDAFFLQRALRPIDDHMRELELHELREELRWLKEINGNA
jgi:hypothetical protein